MSSPAPSSQSNPTKGIQRFGIGINVFIQLLLILVLFGFANYFSYRHYIRKDLSSNKEYTLSDATQKYLRKVKKDIEITTVFTRESEVMQDIRSLVEEYRNERKSKIKIDEIDPARDLERVEQLKLENGLTLKGNGILVRTNNRTRFITEEEIIIRGLNNDRDNPSIDFRGEDALTSAIIGLIEGEVKKFYYIVGKGDTTGKAGEPSYKSLVDLGKQQNFEVIPLNLSEVKEIPQDSNGLVLVGAKYDLSESEMAMVKQYWQTKRASFLVLLDPNGQTPRLKQFLQTNGVYPRPDRVLYAESTSAGPRKEFSVQCIFLGDSPVSKPFRSVASSFSGQTQSLELKRESAELRAQQIEVLPLINAADRFWGESRYLLELPVVDSQDTKPPVHVAASVERGFAEDESLRVDSARMVVVANSLLLDPSTRLEVHQDFVAASINWMLNRERLIGITPKRKQMFRLELTEDQRRLTFWVTCMVMPATMLAMGFMVWSFRRA